MKKLFGATVVAVTLSACAGVGQSEPCMVTVSGNKVCGADAAAWCRATDSLRQSSTDSSLQQTQTDCDSIEQQYPQ